MALRLALLAMLLLASPPAFADERVNADQVYACLMRADDAGDCRDVLQAPCAHMARAGLARACAYRLRVLWQQMLDRDLARLAEILPPEQVNAEAARAERWRAFTERACGRIGRDPGLDDPRTASAQRNRCRIMRTAVYWVELQARTPKLHAGPHPDR